MIWGALCVAVILAALGILTWDVYGQPWPAWWRRREAPGGAAARYWRIVATGTRRLCEQAAAAALEAGEEAKLGRIGGDWAALVYRP